MTGRVVALVAALLLLGACADPSAGTAGTPGGPPGRPAGTDHPDVPDPVNRPAAEREARNLVALFIAPSSAHRLPSRPAAATSLEQLSATPGTPNLVDMTSWWSAPGTPQSVLAAITAPPGATRTGSWSGTANGVRDSIGVMFGLVAKAPIDSVELEVGASRVAGRTVLRVDAVVTYLPPRASGFSIGPAATLTVGATPPGMDEPRPKSLGPVTVVDQREIAAVAALINAAPAPLPGVRGCPADTGGVLRLDFDDPGNTTVVRVTIRLTGCGGIMVTRADGATAGFTGGLDDARTIVKILGLAWNLTR